MDTKEMNIAIYRAIASKANELFRRVKIDAGTYSAKELSENKKDKKYLYWEMKEGYEEITISVESFVCHFVASMVFAVLARFEKLVPAKERVKFTRSEESETICYLFVSISKEAATVAKFAGKWNDMREAYRYVYLDVKKGVLVATNGYHLAVRPIHIQYMKGEIPENGFYIDPKVLKAGEYEIRCIKNNGELFTEVSQGAHVLSCCDYSLRYPNYNSILFEGGKAIRVLDLKTFSVFVKQAAKKKECKLRIETKAGSGRISISAVERWDENNVFSKIEVELLQPATCTAVFGFEPNELLPALNAWTGELFIREGWTCARIGSYIGQTVVVYCNTYDFFTPQISEVIEEVRKVNTMTEPERHNIASSDNKHSKKVIEQAKEFANIITLLRRNVKNRNERKTIQRNLKRFKVLVHDEFFRSVTVLAYAPKSCYTDGTLTDFYLRCALLEKFEHPSKVLDLFPEQAGLHQTFEAIKQEWNKTFANSAAKLANSAKCQGDVKKSVGRKYFSVGRIFQNAQVIQICAQQKLDGFRTYQKTVYGIASEILYDRRRDVVRSPRRSRKVNLEIPGARFFGLPAENSPPVHALSARFNSSFIILNSIHHAVRYIHLGNIDYRPFGRVLRAGIHRRRAGGRIRFRIGFGCP